ncbi:MAG: hypothetical protein ACLFSP_12635 [Spirochaetaceae bacterium]
MSVQAAFLKIRRLALVVLAASIPVVGTVASDLKPAYLDQRANVVLPVGYNRNTDYPVFVVLPPTGLESSRVARYLGLDPRRQGEFILVFPAGRPTRDEYAPDFLSYVQWYEEHVLREIEFVLKNHSADRDRVYVGGYSLGGDLSWALSVRNPELFAGAVIAGSRTSHPVDGDALAALRAADFRGSFLIGNRESSARYEGINHARRRFEEAGIDHRYREYSGAHVIPPPKVFQDEIYYVTEVESLPDPDAPTAAGRPLPQFVEHTSRDRFALRVALPVEINDGGLSLPTEAGIGARVEWPWKRFYLRTTAMYTASHRTTGKSENALSQDLLLATGSSRHMAGLGLGWDLTRKISDHASYHVFDILALHGMRNPWIIPAGRNDPLRLDMLTILRYRVPRGLGEGPAAGQLLNLSAEFLLRIADRVVLDASAGAYTVQNRPVDSLSELSDALDHRLEWGVGVGLRAPSPLLWRAGYRGIGERALPDGTRTYRDLWNLTLEFSY